MNILEARRRLLDGEIKKRTAEGENISVRSVSRMRPGLTLYGKSEQETTTGAQLFDFVSDAGASQTQNGVTITNNGDGSFIVTGTPTITEGVIFTFYFTQGAVIPDGDYCTNVGVRITRKDGSDYFPGSNGIFSFSAETDEYIRFYWQKRTQNYVDGETIWPMLNSGSTALPWEPYTGGAPSPSPDYPQEIKSVGDSGTVNVTLSDGGSQSQTLPVQTPNGLPGIPVSTGGNYTDANGQQWICDEMDFKREVYVQRVKKTSSITWRLHAGYTVEDSELFSAENIKDGIQESSQYNQSFCSKLIRDNSVLNKNKSGFYQSYGSFFARIKGVSELDEFNLLMADAEFLYRLETPIETSLSPSDLAAYSALRTYSPTTVVSNDSGAWMKLDYKTKKSLEVTD